MLMEIAQQTHEKLQKGEAFLDKEMKRSCININLYYFRGGRLANSICRTFCPVQKKNLATDEKYMVPQFRVGKLKWY